MGRRDPQQFLFLCFSRSRRASPLHKLAGVFSLGAQRRDAALHFTAEPGTDYYFRANDIFRNTGHNPSAPAVVSLKPLDSDEARLLMSHFSFSTSNPKK